MAHLGVSSPDEDFLGGYASSDGEDGDLNDDFKHNKLLDAISSLDGKKRSIGVQRTEAASQVSEFHIGAGDAPVKLHELVGALREGSGHGDLKKQLGRIQKKNKVLQVPLAKVQQDRVQRSVQYEEVATEVSKWDPVVKQNRQAEQLQFPLQKPNVRMHTTGELVSRFQPRTPLEQEVAALLHGSEHVIPKTKELSKAEERALKAMSLEEAKERRAELQKYRALLSYKEAKARRQNKIKSKKYHRVLRKERQKAEKRGLEEMQKNDPEGFTDYLQKIEQDRAEERVSLRHKGGSRYMQKQTLFGKYDKDARQAVQDMLQKSQELTKKMHATESSDESDQEDGVEMLVEEDTTGQSETTSNPWMASAGRIKILEKPKERQQETKETSTVKPAGDTSRPKNTPDQSSLLNPVVSHGEIHIEEKNIVHGDKMLNHDSDVDMDELFSQIEKKRELRKKDLKGKSSKKSVKKRLQENQKSKGESKPKKLKKDLKGDHGKNAKSTSEKKSKSGKKITQKDKKKNTKGDAKLPESEDSSDEEEDFEEPQRSKVGKSSLLKPDSAVQEETLISTSLTRKQTLEDLEEEEDWSDEEPAPAANAGHTAGSVGKAGAADISTEAEVDPTKLLTLEHRIRPSHLPTLVEDEDDEDRDLLQHMTIAEAFAEDDVVEEFAEEKKAVEDRDKPKDIDLTLPGWGEWGGTGVVASSKKRKRFLIKALPAPPRKDVGLDNVIISETKDRTIAKHQVNQLPFPFRSVSQFESSVRAPIGNTWNPETSFKKLIKPKLTTRKGVVIEPISKEEVFKKQKVQQQSVTEEKNKGKGNHKGKSFSKDKKGKRREQIKSAGKIFGS